MLVSTFIALLAASSLANGLPTLFPRQLPEMTETSGLESFKGALGNPTGVGGPKGGSPSNPGNPTTNLPTIADGPKNGGFSDPGIPTTNLPTINDGPKNGSFSDPGNPTTNLPTINDGPKNGGFSDPGNPTTNLPTVADGPKNGSFSDPGNPTTNLPTIADGPKVEAEVANAVGENSTKKRTVVSFLLILVKTT